MTNNKESCVNEMMQDRRRFLAGAVSCGAMFAASRLPVLADEQQDVCESMRKRTVIFGGC